MNKKFFIISLSILLLIIVCSSIVLANFNISTTEEKLVPKNTITIDESYVREHTKNIDTKENIQLAENHLETFNLTDRKFNTDETTIAIYNNNLESLTETVISDSNMIVKLNSETGELISYISNQTTFDTNTLSEDMVEKKALELFKNIENSSEYEMILLTKFDEEIYQAKFCKKYGKYVDDNSNLTKMY